jgi:hypothetical protein
VRTLTYTWHQTNGASETGTWSLYANGAFTDSQNRTGQWAYQAAFRRVVLLYNEGSACDAFLLGNAVQPTLVRGISLCGDGSGAISVWRATFHPELGEPLRDQGSTGLLSDTSLWRDDGWSSHSR